MRMLLTSPETPLVLQKVSPAALSQPVPPAVPAPVALRRRSAVCVLAALLPWLEPSACVADAAADAVSGVYGRNERIVVPILGDLMGMMGPAGIQLDRATAQLGKLVEVRQQLDQLTAELQAPGYRADAEASAVVLRLSAIYFKTAAAAMELTSKLMTRLGSDELAEAQAVTARFEAAVQALERGCRDQDLEAEIAAASAASSQLGAYFRVASLAYTVPTVPAIRR
eukprot:5828763-Prymnesium_polylepis.1